MRTQHTVTVNGKVEKRVKLIEDYWNSLEEKPDMTFKQFEAICKTPFQHMRKNISQEKLYDFRFKYLGSFAPVPSNTVWALESLRIKLREQKITRELYQTRTQAMLDYIKLNPKPFKRFKETLKHWIQL